MSHPHRWSDIHDPREDYIKPLLLTHAQRLECQMFLFGSRAKGMATAKSDRDIAVQRVSEPLSTMELLNLRELFDETPYRVDIVDVTQRQDRFAQLAMRDVILVW